MLVKLQSSLVPRSSSSLLIQVGLPARGKTHLSVSLSRYLKWSPPPTTQLISGSASESAFSTSVITVAKSFQAKTLPTITSGPKPPPKRPNCAPKFSRRVVGIYLIFSMLRMDRWGFTMLLIRRVKDDGSGRIFLRDMGFRLFSLRVLVIMRRLSNKTFGASKSLLQT